LTPFLSESPAQAEREAELCASNGCSRPRVDEDLVDLLGMLSAIFSISTPPSLLTIRTMRFEERIEDEAEIQLAIDGEAFLDEQRETFWPLGPV
jgi:hypothetical protein